jgi:hypothetical protein
MQCLFSLQANGSHCQTKPNLPTIIWSWYIATDLQPVCKKIPKSKLRSCYHLFQFQVSRHSDSLVHVNASIALSWRISMTTATLLMTMSRTDRRSDGQTDGRTDRRTDERTGGRTDEQTNEHPYMWWDEKGSSPSGLMPHLFHPPHINPFTEMGHRVPMTTNAKGPVTYTPREGGKAFRFLFYFYFIF